MSVSELLVSAAQFGVNVGLGVSPETGLETAVMTGEVGKLPDRLRADLKANKMALVAYLRDWQSTKRHGMGMYVSKTLDIQWFADAITGAVPAMFYGARPYWRLTPDSLVWFVSAVTPRLQTMDGEDQIRILAIIEALKAFVEETYPPHLVALAYAKKLPLCVPETPIDIPDRGPFMKPGLAKFYERSVN